MANGIHVVIMFSKSLDNKKKVTIDSSIEIVDLTESIFDHTKAMTEIVAMYKVSKEYEMRPDLISKALYGSTDYTEMVLKYSLINNPFAIEKGDLIYAATLSNIYNPVKETEAESTATFNAIKNYHKYIDKNKVPSQAGSDKVSTTISSSSSGQEANISKTGGTGITVKNGKVYFGAIDETLSSVDSSIVDCATSGATLGEFLNATLNSSNL